MRRLKLGLTCIALGMFAAYGGYLCYLAWLTNNGYCHAEGKYLTDDEKIRVALIDVLREYPPSVIRTPIDPTKGGNLTVPKDPINYRDVNEFLYLNPDCCKVRPTETYTEGSTVTLLEKLTGTASSVIETNYLVRYRGEDGLERSIKTTPSLHITNCGTPGKPWSPF